MVVWMMLCGDGVFDVVCEVVLCGGMIDFMLFGFFDLLWTNEQTLHIRLEANFLFNELPIKTACGTL